MDDSVDKLSNVSERYKQVEMFALKPESSDSETEQQGQKETLRDEAIRDMTTSKCHKDKLFSPVSGPSGTVTSKNLR